MDAVTDGAPNLRRRNDDLGGYVRLHDISPRAYEMLHSNMIKPKFLRNCCFLVCLIGSLSACTEPAPKLSEVWRLTAPIAYPESVVFDEKRNVLYVSNIAKPNQKKDRKGFIARIAVGGKSVPEKFITDLHRPYGIALHQNELYIADIDQVLVADLETGEITERYDAPGAIRLNDIVVDSDGPVYISDSKGDKLWRLLDGKMQPWIDSPQLRSPNGLLLTEEGLIVAAGDESQAKPDASRYLKTVSADGNLIEPLYNNTPIGAVDAVESDRHSGFFLTDWRAGTVMHVSSNRKPPVKILQKLTKGAANLTYIPDKNLLVVPIMLSSELIAYRVEW